MVEAARERQSITAKKSCNNLSFGDVEHHSQKRQAKVLFGRVIAGFDVAAASFSELSFLFLKIRKLLAFY